MADTKKLIAYINAENELDSNVIKLAQHYCNQDMDELYLYNLSFDDTSKAKFFALVKDICRQVDLPVSIGVSIQKMEDVKKALYTGARRVIIQEKDGNSEKLKEFASRFGREKIWLEKDCQEKKPSRDWLLGCDAISCGGILLKHVSLSEDCTQLDNLPLPIIIRDSLKRNDIMHLMRGNSVVGVATNYFENKDVRKAKLALKAEGFLVKVFESSLPFSELKCNGDGLIPVVVQDYKTREVLMLAYMNEEAYLKTIETGKMTYFSRSRQELWVKGSTSGHFQFVKALTIDCDNDTILAKVLQVGAACHTGEQSCFFRDLVTKEYDRTNPMTVLSDLYEIIMDRKKNPKEGSYTNYLFEQGIDKILKKCGEEATEIVIAAKNPDAEELKYEISDFLYHLMVLMAECDLSWLDIMKELAQRR